LFFPMRTNDFPPYGSYSLWKSDGTTSGTTIMKTFNGNMGILTATNGIMFLGISDYATNQVELWKSDGSSNGTVKLYNFKSISAVFGDSGIAYFGADDSTNGVELWVSDGISTFLIKDINPGLNSSYPCNFIVMDSTLFFSADDGVNGRELWKLTGVPNNGIEKINDKNLTLKVFPNPFNNSTKISYYIYSTSIVTLEIYNSIGQKLSSMLNNEKQQAGNYEFSFSENQTGIYFVKLQVNDKIYSYPIIQTK